MIFYSDGRSRNIGVDIIRTAKAATALAVLCMVILTGTVAYNFYQLSNVRTRYSMAVQKSAAEETEIKGQLVILEDFEEKISFFLGGVLEQQDNTVGAMGGGEEFDQVVENDLESASESSTLQITTHNNYNSQTSDQRVNRLKVRLSELAELALAKKYLLDFTPSILPTPGYMTSRFGWRRSPFTGQRHFHRGVDIVNKLGTPIRASANGKVVFAGKKEFWGNTVWIMHRDGIISKYGHMSKFDVAMGDTIDRGQVIGKIGMSGRSTGPHLHYQIEMGDKAVDPMRFVIKETYN